MIGGWTGRRLSGTSARCGFAPASAPGYGSNAATTPPTDLPPVRACLAGVACTRNTRAVQARAPQPAIVRAAAHCAVASRRVKARHRHWKDLLEPHGPCPSRCPALDGLTQAARSNGRSLRIFANPAPATIS